jgi:hypothetical protein
VRLKTDWAMPRLAVVAKSELPPEEIRGSVTPVMGKRPMFIPMLTDT